MPLEIRIEDGEVEAITVVLAQSRISFGAGVGGGGGSLRKVGGSSRMEKGNSVVRYIYV